MFGLKEILVILIGYGLGCISSAYYLVYFRIGQDIRQYGSGNVGARNASRVLGPSGFVIAFLGDVAKGAAAVGLALYFELSPLGVMLAMIAVVAGHIWPAQLGFRGGKGIATALGVLLVFDIQIVLILLLVFVIVFALVRQFTLSGLIIVAIAPIVAIVLNYSAIDLTGIIILALFILSAHRKNIQTIINARREQSQIKTSNSKRE